jgi:GntR family carbon starvation induced transcriptional regulator
LTLIHFIDKIKEYRYYGDVRVKKNLVSLCFDAVKEGILSGKCLPDAKLNICALAEELKIGPTPVREALSRLSTTGLVKYVENCGFKAAPISELELRDFAQTLVELEKLALEKALSHGKDDWEAGIVAALYQLSLVEKGKNLTAHTYPLWKERNEAFHRALIAGCPSECLLEVRNDVYRRFDRYFNLVYPPKNSEPIPLTHKEHEILAATALARNKKKMALLIEEHVTSGINHFVELLKTRKLI